MALRRKSDATWLSVYPVHTEASNWPVEKALYVNIGGGVGHQCAQFRERYPYIDRSRRAAGHAAFCRTSTPYSRGREYGARHGAKFYHLRAVLHNHPPEKIKQLLNIIKAAMGPESVLLIDEMGFPEREVSFNTASIDMTMLAAFATMERTEAQWREVFEDAGLELVRTYTYYPVNYESVMDVRLPLPAQNRRRSQDTCRKTGQVSGIQSSY
ncbi:hypothetical protein ANO14919_137500 [Xylariales sp. No.14919]|nr:hypothetical protein ANO14919_137500 [Xylariales sp. No.14919]